MYCTVVSTCLLIIYIYIYYNVYHINIKLLCLVFTYVLLKYYYTYNYCERKKSNEKQPIYSHNNITNGNYINCL